MKFGVTGLSGMVLDFSVTWLFKDVLFINKFLANAIGFTVAVISNYLINRVWTFQSKAKMARQFAGFATVSVIGLLLNTLIVYVFNHLLSLNFYFSKVIAVGLVFIWNFSVNYFFIFKSKSQTTDL
ncbi:GtrA family protein [Pedobacter immunditicola]|uniref:GtrA family protein n=1 Tax=Pedobacter immunditicola TaxID=3133440 RepID=UPI0030B728FC